MEYKSKDGYRFAKKDKSAVYENILVLGKFDSIDNYIEITEEEATQILKELEAKENGNRFN